MWRLALAGLLLTTTALAQEPPVNSAQPGRITGVVVTDGGLPVAGAEVTRHSVADNDFLSTVVSDASGAFEFSGVPHGTLHLSVTKPGLFQVSGTATARSGSRTTRVRAGEHVRGVTLTLARAGVVTGRIVDEFGDPVEQLEVRALRFGPGMDRRRALLRTGDYDLTDDRGEFRLFGLPPGDYVVSAVTPPKGPADPNAGPLAALMAANETLPLYFPGTHDVATARSITVGAGQETPVAFVWRAARSLRVSGTVVSARPFVGAMITLGDSSFSGRPTTVGPGGSFVIEGVSSGDYVLSVRNGREVTSVPIVVGPADVTGLVVTLMPPVLIRGRVTFDGARPPSTDLRFISSDGGDLTSMLIGDYATVRPDGQFAVESSASHVTVEAPSGWSVTGLSIDGTDAFASGIDLSGRTSVDNVHVRLTNKLTRVIGRATLDRGEPLDNGVVVLLRLDAAPAPLRSVMRTLRTEADGRFEAEGLRRGSYVAVAIDASEVPGTDDEFLDRLRTAGRRFSLEDGQAVTLDLTPSEALR